MVFWELFFCQFLLFTKFTYCKFKAYCKWKAKKTLAAQTESRDFLRKTRLGAHNHYSDKMHKWNLLVIMLIVLGQVCESFTYVFETRIDIDLQLFRKETSYLLIRRSISLNLQINLLIRRWYFKLQFSLTVQIQF